MRMKCEGEKKNKKEKKKQKRKMISYTIESAPE